MRAIAAATLTVLMLSIPALADHDDPEVLTNYDVIELVRADLSEEVILSKIAASPVDFDTSTDAIIALKEAGVSDDVIATMIVRQTGAPWSGTSARDVSPGDPMAVELVTEHERFTLAPTQAKDKYVYAFVAHLWFKRIEGEHSDVQIRDRQPSLYLPRTVGGVKVNLDGVFLVKFDIDDDDGVRDYRLDWGTPWSYAVDNAPDEDYIVSYDYEVEGDRIRITPRRSLRRGEYGLVDEHFYVYDFSLE